MADDFDTTLARFMTGIGQIESGGNYNTPPNRAGASGKYQFIDSTWGGYGGYQHAYQAPPEIQDQRARQLMTAYYQKFGDWNSVAQAWLGGPGSVGKHVSDGNITTDEYANRVLAAAGMTNGGTPTPAPPSAAGSSSPQTTTASADDRHNLGTQLSTFLDIIGAGTPAMPAATSGMVG